MKFERFAMKKFFCLLFALTTLFSLAAQVDRQELESFDYGGVEFRNYEGPHQKIDTIDQIRGIGLVLTSRGDGIRSRYFDKYEILHLVDPEAVGLLNADVFILSETAGVDHIDNIRRILSAYLEEAYGYSRTDSDLLARFVTYYNAVYRQNLTYFTGKYTSMVLEVLTADKVGLSTRYEEWPGRTQIVIPLTGREGAPALDTDALTEKDVIESLRQEDDRSLDERKEMTELKEKEIQTEEKAIEEERQALEQRETEVAREERDIAEEDRRITEAEEEGTLTPDEAEEARQGLEERRDEAAKEADEIQQAAEDLEEREAVQEDRLEQIREEREQIAQDTRELQTPGAGPAAAEPVGVPFLTYRMDGGERLGRLVLVNSETGSTLTRSTLDNIHTPGFLPHEGGYLVIAGEDSGNRMVSLVLLDSKKLTVTASGDTRVSRYATVYPHQGSLYTVVDNQGRWVPGRFDKDLKLTGILDRDAAEYSYFGFDGGKILFQDGRGGIVSVPLTEFAGP
jgi:hypothetical protein